ncbi:MAG: hypothetical protein IK058_01735, partial [Bacteroidales bacterium]|nr:hypothetical protein [Bacteroidales bacterium]
MAKFDKKGLYRNAFLAYTFALESKCKSTNYFPTGKINFQGTKKPRAALLGAIVFACDALWHYSFTIAAMVSIISLAKVIRFKTSSEL